VKNKSLVLSLGTIVLSVILLYSCKKINDATELGDDLIPPIDNINTFDTILEVQAFNDTFGLANDSTLSFRDDEHFLGRITNDPFFGQTDARIYLQLKPNVYKYNFANKTLDSLFIDSVVLVMGYVETYGDTTANQTINVYEIDQSSQFRRDSSYKIRQTPVTNGTLLGSRILKPMDLNDSVKAYQDTTKNQMRIRLDNSFGTRLLAYDTAAGDAYYNDSTFNTKFKGFALQSVGGGNAIMGFNLGGDTKLAIYYRYYKGGVSNIDTTVAYWTFAGNLASASHNYIQRNYAGTPLEASVGGTTPDDLVYMQLTPGTFSTLKVPALSGLSNRVVHRAELLMEEVYHISDSTFPPPPALFLEAYDSTGDKPFRNIPYDFVMDFQGAFDFATFGSYPFRGLDQFNNPIYKWNFNLTRYVQNIVNGKEKAYPSFRLSAPLEATIMYRFNAQSESVKRTFGVNGVPAKGRVRLAGGNHPSVQKMRLRLVYSKI
jgi:hypothetical protein